MANVPWQDLLGCGPTGPAEHGAASAPFRAWAPEWRHYSSITCAAFCSDSCW